MLFSSWKWVLAYTDLTFISRIVVSVNVDVYAPYSAHPRQQTFGLRALAADKLVLGTI